MDIRDIQAGSTAAPESSRRARAAAGASSSRQGGSVDRVALSQMAQAIQQARRAAEAVPEVREERVEEVRGRLATGSLVPHPTQIARALLDQHILD
jgi:flagellar biosynthesis anti-sigma factor FlgM